MKKIASLFIITLLLPNLSTAQPVIGKLVDENGAGLAEVQLQLYADQNVYNTISDSDGSFIFNNITSVEDNQLPTGYAVSNNFPNPFNPTTRIGITLLVRENVKIEVFNILGETVTETIERFLSAGMNYIDLELNGLSNGIYISRITVEGKFSATRKMMLIYGSQHLMANGTLLNKELNGSKNYFNPLDTEIDSLVAASLIIGRKTFTNLPNMSGDTLDLGNLTIERYCSGTPTVTYGGKVYNTVQIGTQCWLRENLDVGTMIQGNQTDNGIKEKYCYDNDPANCTTYGGLYQWDETMQYTTTAGTQGICPSGWHITTLTEFQTLSTAVGGDGNTLKAIGQGVFGGAGTNTSGFSALLAGYRHYSGYFYYLGNITGFWSSTERNSHFAYTLDLSYEGSGISLYDYYKTDGFSVRCVKD